MSYSQIRQVAVRGIRMSLLFAVGRGVRGRSAEAAQFAGENLVGQPAELSAWAYAYRADRQVQGLPGSAPCPSQAGTARSGIPSTQPIAFSRERKETNT